ncbi:MAG: tetratricopeptide repeat protein [Dehalococcoidia bacterium]
MERARLLQPALQLTSATAPAVAALCGRLDGIPLAIELAAARVNVLSVEEIVKRLDDRFRLLTGGSPTAPPRQRTLQATIDWSYDLLRSPEQALFRRLGVFSGTFGLEAAEAIAAAGDRQSAIGNAAGAQALEPLAVTRDGSPAQSAVVVPQPFEVLDLVQRLVEKSLVIAEVQTAQSSYRLLETLREYARERLGERGESESVRQRHIEYYLRLAALAAPNLRDPVQARWLEMLEGAYDNLRAALDWLSQHGELEAGLRLTGFLWRFWELRGYFSEGRGWLEAMLGPGSGSPAARATALHGAGMLAYHQGDHARALACCFEGLERAREAGDEHDQAALLELQGVIALEQGQYDLAEGLHRNGLQLYRSLGDRQGEASLLRHIGRLALQRGDSVTARARYEESLALCRDYGFIHGYADSLANLGLLAHRAADYPAARSFHEQSLATYRDLGHRESIALELYNLGEIARLQADYGRAHPLLTEALALFSEGGHQRGMAQTLGGLGHVARAQADYALARSLIGQSLRLRYELGEHQGVAFSLEGLALTDAARGQPEEAARLFGAAAALRESIQAPLPPAYQNLRDRALEEISALLGDAALASALADGGALPLEQVIIEALSNGASVPVTQHGEPTDATQLIGSKTVAKRRRQRRRLSAYPDELSEREVEVLRLIAAGRSNREIAAALVLSVRTAERHITNILEKTGAHSKADATAYAYRRGLARQ